jgi:hypothetical protein
MRRKKPKPGLSPEHRALMGAARGIVPCRKFGKASPDRFIAHFKEGKCERGIAFIRRWARESEMVRFLEESRN